MIIAICLDNHNGMLFNGRRQSRDSRIVEHISTLAKDTKLWINDFSLDIFQCCEISVSNSFLNDAASGEYCFVENVDIVPYSNKIEKIIIYKWNRDYPRDKVFKIIEDFELTESYEIGGNSHKNITVEVFRRR